MKEWWHQLSLRDKQLFCIAIFLLSLAIYYYGILMPLHQNVLALRQKVQNQATLLTWMQQAEKAVDRLSQKAKSTKVSQTSLLTIMQNEISAADFAKHLSKLHQVDTNAIQFSIETVEFDALIMWLTKLSKMYHITVTETSLLPANKPGTVTGNLTLVNI